MNEWIQQQLQALPQVDWLLRQPFLQHGAQSVSRAACKDAVRMVLQQWRQHIHQGAAAPSMAQLAADITAQLQQRQAYHLDSLINATGTVLHTNLGRARLNEELSRHIAQVANSYSNVEYELVTGQRGSRYSHVQALIQKLTGAEDCLVVNNNAAAVLLALSTLALGREVILSRGELVEIGGMFRMPDVIRQSGGIIQEVGTTNQTHLADYEDAVQEQTGAILKVHTSNYRIIGFTSCPPVAELAALAHRHGIPLLYDLGSGLLTDLQPLGLPYEPTVKEVLQQGCDVALFSGDKLLGGAQAGIIAGSACYIEKMKKNQLLRALRVDKLTLAALEGTLKLYAEKDPIKEIPTLAMLAESKETCLKKAQLLAASLRRISAELVIEIMPCDDVVGGGAYPGCTLPGYMVAISSPSSTANEWERRLRCHRPAVIGRIYQNKMAFSVRTMTEEELSRMPQIVADCLQERS